MILPTKHIPTSQSLLGVGAVLLPMLGRDTTITRLWEQARVHPEVATFERFVLALDLLFTLDLIDFTGGVIRRKKR